MIPGAKTPEQARANSGAADLAPLTDEALAAISGLYRERVAPHVHHRW